VLDDNETDKIVMLDSSLSQHKRGMLVNDCLDAVNNTDDQNVEYDNDIALNDDVYEDMDKQYEFLNSHPQYQTHYIQHINDDNIVPNFLGGSLPRCDQEDREYCCLTMLTIFKPWRSGKDLKSNTHTWDITFL
jgi:hypothetical protein